MTRSPIHNRHAKSLAILLATLAVIIPSSVMAQSESGSKTVAVIGTGHIKDGDISTARQDAISDALVTAVGMVTTDLLHQLVLVESFQDINRLLLSDAGSFVQYKILTETTSGKIYRVMVEIDISIDRIQNLLAQNNILVQNETPLSVLLLIAEKQLDDTTYRSWWSDPFVESLAESGLSDTLTSQGIQVIDHGQSLPATLEAYLEETDSSNGWNLSDSQAAYFGTWYQADVVVVGYTIAERAPNAMGDELRSFRGTLTVRALRSNTAELLTEYTRNVLTADADDIAGSQKALSEVGTRAGALLTGKIQSAWKQSEKTGPMTVTVVVKGGYQLSHFVAFRRMLSELPGVNGLQTSSMTPEETVLNLEYDGTPQEMAEVLLLKSFEDFGIYIAEASPDTLRLSLVPN